MNARGRIRFTSPAEEDLHAMHSLASSLTNNRESARDFADERPGVLS